MPVDLAHAEMFVLTHGRLLERQRMALLRGAGDTDGVLRALAAYQNPDGGYGHALEPDVRSPHSETTSTLTALELLAHVDALATTAAGRALSWVGSVVRDDGGIPFLLRGSLDYPRAPWMELSDGGSHLTFGYAAIAHRAGCTDAWVEPATAWCWSQLADPTTVNGYLLKYALIFLDAHPDDPRSTATVDAFRGLVDEDGCLPVPGGIEDEKLTPLDLSPEPGSLSRRLFDDEQVERDLTRVAEDQQDDGGWTFDWLEWCPAQGLDWRGIRTVQAVATLAAHGVVPRKGET